MTKKMGRPPKLTADQQRLVGERHLLYIRLRLEAAKHSPSQLAKELGVTTETINVYLSKPRRGAYSGLASMDEAAF